MLVFIDESGDPGFSLGRGSSKVFVIACIVFDDTGEAEKVSQSMKKLKKELRFPSATELKFNKSSKHVRLMVLKAIKKRVVCNIYLG